MGGVNSKVIYYLLMGNCNNCGDHKDDANVSIDLDLVGAQNAARPSQQESVSKPLTIVNTETKLVLEVRTW